MVSLSALTYGTYTAVMAVVQYGKEKLALDALLLQTSHSQLDAFYSA